MHSAYNVKHNSIEKILVHPFGGLKCQCLHVANIILIGRYKNGIEFS
jgi:hypothetical protein